MRFIKTPYPHPAWITMACLALALLGLTACAVPDRTMENRVTAQVRELDRLATRYYREGRLDDAIMYAREIVTRVESVVGPDDVHLAQPLNNLAVLYEKAGRFEEAETLYQRVLSILIARLGPDHVRTALNRARLGAFYSRLGRLAEARACYEESLKNLEKRLNPNHPLLSEPLSGLSGVMLALEKAGPMDKPDQAWTLLERAGSILEKAGPKEKLHLAAVLQSQSGIKAQQENFGEAETLLLQAIAIIDQTLGPDHAMARDARLRLAKILLFQGNSAGALDSLAQSLESVQRPMERAAAMFTTDSRLAFVASIYNDLNLYLQLVLQNRPVNSGDVARAYTLWLTYKDLDLKIQPAFQAAFLRKNCDNNMDTYRALVDKTLDLARTEMAVPDPEETSGYKKRLEQLFRQRDQLENQLKAACPEFAVQTARDTAKTKEVMAALNSGEALVEYVHLESINLNDKGGTSKNLPQRYAAFVITPDALELLDLGPAEPIDAAILENEKDHQSGDPQKPTAIDLLVRPLEQSLSGKTKIFIAPHGPLHTMPFETLLNRETITVQVIPTGSVLVGQKNKKSVDGPNLLFVDPDFYATKEARQRVLKKFNIVSPVQPDGKRGQGIWGFQLPPMPETDDQLINEKANTSANVHTGESALEDILRGQNHPPKTLLIKTRCLGDSSHSTNGNPLRDCGLAMAGANHSLADPDLTHSPNILTAEEIILTNFTNTNVTLISDCHTDRSGNTTRILRRAFFRAGARTVCFKPLASNPN